MGWRSWKPQLLTLCTIPSNLQRKFPPPKILSWIQQPHLQTEKLSSISTLSPPNLICTIYIMPSSCLSKVCHRVKPSEPVASALPYFSLCVGRLNITKHTLMIQYFWYVPYNSRRKNYKIAWKRDASISTVK